MINGNNLIISFRNNLKIAKGTNYNYVFNIKNGFFIRWDKTKFDDPEFSSVLKTAIMDNNIITILLKTQLVSNCSKIRSLRVHNRKIEQISSDELEICFSVDSQTGMPINPPRNYIFKEFNQI